MFFFLWALLTATIVDNLWTIPALEDDGSSVNNAEKKKEMGFEIEIFHLSRINYAV